MKTKIVDKKVVQSFYSEEINSLVDGMTSDEMITQIKELEDTRYWVAVVKYIQDRMLIANRTLIMLDPVKEPSKIARTQGIMSGLMDLYNMAVAAKQPIEKAEKEYNERNEESPDMEEGEQGY